MHRSNVTRYALHATVLLCLIAGLAPAQSDPAPLRFEVASVKVAPPRNYQNFSSRSGPGPNRYTATNTTLRTMIRQAYQVKDNQLQCPEWMDTEIYDVNARAAEGTSPKQIWEMLQNLLQERFQLKLHREERETAIYLLIVGKNAHKLKESSMAAPAPPSAATPAIPPAGMPPRIEIPPKDKDGFPILARSGWASTSSSDGLVKVSAVAQSMPELARMLSSQVGRDVVDQTGLTGRYDYRLEYGGSGRMVPSMTSAMPRSGAAGTAPPGSEAADPSGPAGPTLFKAVQDQLGLKLEPSKAPREFIVVEKALKVPIEN